MVKIWVRFLLGKRFDGLALNQGTKPMRLKAVMGIAALATAALLGVSRTAEAAPLPLVPTPITTPPPVILVNGDVKVIYISEIAANHDYITQVSPVPSVGPIFCNHPVPGCAVASVTGQVVDLGSQTGVLDFSMTNTATGNTFDQNLPSAVDGFQHILVTADFSILNLGPDPIAAYLSALDPSYSVIFLGFEDKTNKDKPKGDYDYNDLVMAVAYQVRNVTQVPEPYSFALLSAGLAGLASLARRKKKRAK